MSRVPIGNAFAGTQTLANRLKNAGMMKFEMILEIPALIEPGNTRLTRKLNKIVKEALKEEMIHHHKKRIPHHFDPFKQKKYHYKKRDPKTIERKRRKRGLAADLVQSGKTKRSVKSRIDIRMSGTAGKGDVAAKGKVFLKRGMRPARENNDVSIDQMADEIKTMTSQEVSEIAIGYSERIIQKLDAALTGRVRRRVRSQLKSLGIR